MKRLFAFFLGILLYFCPFAIYADELDSSLQDIPISEDVQIVDVPRPKSLTEEEIDELLGEDPYLGQTSWLGSKVTK